MPGMSASLHRMTIEMEGILQGVGFRPTIQRLAAEAGLSGWVQNRSGSVRMVVGGAPDALEAFVAALPSRLPPRARLERLTATPPEPLNGEALPWPFEILESESDPTARVSIPADLASCDACLREVFDPHSRYFGYPFTTCTDCGPRYTVVDGMPYDRERTALQDFPLCPSCLAEYRDPANRRFHAESIACPVCGPRLALQGGDGRPLPGDPLGEARRLLAQGALLAVRGLGGFLLACDARSRPALARLRERKRRPDKPFAIMARSLDVLRTVCDVPAAAVALFSDPISPIVILEALPATADALPLDLLAPDTHEIGAMLPTTPLHALLFEPLQGDETPPFDFLVMTSGNRGGEPIATANNEALDRLSGIADAFLVHDRRINLRCDDSLVALQAGAPQVWRRARGYAPEALVLAAPLDRRVLAMGAELKNTIAVGAGSEIVLSPHVGDLETPEAEDGLRQVASRLPEYLGHEPEAIAVDLHPDMRSTRLGRAIAARAGIPVVEVQHHHAHAAAALAELGLDRILALVFDGTGLGDDGVIWGAEALVATASACQRIATFAAVPLPGGDAAVREPVRQFVARLAPGGLSPDDPRLDALGVTPDLAALWAMQAQRGINAPRTHAAGRVFDAYAAALGIAPRVVSYEGQAAIRLEAAARSASRAGTAASVPFDLRDEDGLLVVDWARAFAELPRRFPDAGGAAALALGFHEAMARACVAMASRARDAGAPDTVVLTGGVFMNRLLVATATRALEEAGFRALIPRAVPPNDGGIALGQALVAGRTRG